MRLTAVATELARLLAAPEAASEGVITSLARHARQLAANLPGDPDAAELARLAATAAKLRR